MQRAVAAAKAADWRKTSAFLKFAQMAKPNDPDVAALTKWLKGASKPLFVDDFDGGTIRRWEVENGNWRIERGQLACLIGYHNAQIFIKGARTQDFVLRFDMKNTPGEKGFRMGAIVRQRPSRFLYFAMTDQYNGLCVGGATGYARGPAGRAPGVSLRCTRGTAAYPVETDRTYHVSVRCAGRNLEWYIDGELVAEGTDEKPVKGRLGFHVHRADARFDNVRIYRAVPLPKLQFTPPR
jgi:hypothetical protein